MRFTKMHGIGNDYIYIEHRDWEAAGRPEKAALARRLSHRHFGIGGDGIIFINPSETADFEMEMYNADGSRAEMCGNGIRCVGKYVYDHGLTDQTTVRIESMGRVKTLQLHLFNAENCTIRSRKTDQTCAVHIPENPFRKENSAEETVFGETSFAADRKGSDHFAGQQKDARPDMQGEAACRQGRMTVDTVTVDMGIPEILEEEFSLEILGKAYTMTSVSTGNPHAVTFVADTDSFPVCELGPHFEHHPHFPNRTNTEFIQVLDRENLKMRVWERGTGETLACGTGACASAAAAFLKGLCGREVTIHLLGGDLQIRLDEESGHVLMTGEAREVFSGECVL